MVHDRHEVVWRVRKLWTLKAHLTKVTYRLSWVSLIDATAFHHQDQLIEKPINIGIWLMDCHQDGFSLNLGQPPQVVAYDISG